MFLPSLLDPPPREFSVLVSVSLNGTQVVTKRLSTEFVDRWVAAHNAYHRGRSSTFWYRINVKEKKQ